MHRGSRRRWPGLDGRRQAVIIALVLVCSGASAALEPQAEEGDITTPPGPPNLALKTMGGKQFWADELVFRSYRIQRHALTGHHRLLDTDNRRLAWGTFAHCVARLEQIKLERELPALEGKVVILLHGLFRTRGSMSPLASYLQAEGGYETIDVGYPSTRGAVARHADSLARVIGHLDAGIVQIDFVAHSLGNLVLRHYLADQTDPVESRQPDPRIGRIVMLGAPNQGAVLAERLVPIDATGQIAGAAAAQLARDWNELEPRLATPTVPFGILAGGRGNEVGYNPLIPGDDDGVVSVASTRLPGARDFRRLPVLHTVMMKDPHVLELTLHFLQTGCFESEDLRQPIDAQPADRTPD